MIKQSVFFGFVCIVLALSVFGQENETINITEEFNETFNGFNETVYSMNITEANETNATEINETEIICSLQQCDLGCAVCSDGSCYAQEVGCIEQLFIDKITPATIAKGEQQLNILIRNTGNVALPNIEADVVGFGITTVEKMPIEILLAGDKDYTFTKINVTESGTIDIIVKLYVNHSLKTQEIFQLAVAEGIVEGMVQETAFNATAASEQLEAAKSHYNELEKEYYEKEKEQYLLYGIKEDLDDIKESLRLAQVAIIEDYSKEFDNNIAYATASLQSVQEQLASAEKEKKTLWQIVYENLAVIGTVLGVLISIITVWSMTRVHLKKARIINVIKGKQILNIGKKEDVENIIEKDSKKNK